MNNPFDLDQSALGELDSALEDSLEKLLSSRSSEIENSHAGNPIKARFLHHSDRELYFDIGEKQEGICAHSEFDEIPNVGEEFSVAIVRRDSEGIAQISKKEADQRLTWLNIKDAYEAKANLSGIINRVLPSGYILDYKGLKLFMPLSQSSINVNLTKKFETGKEVDFRVLELKEKLSSAVISHRQVIEERNDVLWDQFLQNHSVDDIVEGIVVKKVSYGIFIEVESLVALLHISDISWKSRPSFKNKFHVKSKIKLKILKLDRENNRINLGLKQLTQEPWPWAKQELKESQTVKAKVLSLTNYGAFLEIREGLEGLLHISEISWQPKKSHPKEHLSIGQEIDVQIVNMDVEKKRISFSLKNLCEDPWEKLGDKIKVGDICSGKITGITSFGTFVSIFDDIKGMIHCKDYSWEKTSTKQAKKPTPKIFKKGQSIQFKILEIDEKNRRIGCGYKQLTDSPHITFKKTQKKGTILNCTIKKITAFGIAVKLENGMDAFIPKTQIAAPSPANEKTNNGRRNIEPKQNMDLQKTYKAGEKITAVLQDVDVSKKHIYLSIKAYRHKQERDFVKQYTKNEHSPAMSTPFAELLAKQKNKD